MINSETANAPSDPSKKVWRGSSGVWLYGVMLVLLILLLGTISLCSGIKDISVQNFYRLNEDDRLVLVVSRIPRLLAVVIAGIGMSVSGMIAQQIVLNRFVSPTTMGTLDATKLGILASLIIFPAAGVLTKVLIAFLFAMVLSMVFLKIVSKFRFQSLVLVPLVGLVFGNVISAVATFFAFRYGIVQNMEGWLMGDFSYIIQGNYEVLYLAIPAVVLSYLFAARFTIAGLGRDSVKSLGLSYRQIVGLGLSLIAVTSTVVVLTAGVIPFLGLIVPNMVSLLLGDNLKKTLPCTALAGAAFLLFCDILSRKLIYPYELPIGLVVSIIGGSIFLAMIFKRRKYAQ